MKVSSSANLNYEIATKHTITVKSTDSGSPSLSTTKSFTIKVLDVNERPTSVSLNKNVVVENSPMNMVIGTLSTVDPDNSQTFTYTLLDDVSGRFRLDGAVLKVAASNVKCLALGGDECLLNYETAQRHTIKVRVTDSGSPALSIDVTLTIKVTDANDKPRALDLSSNDVHENEPVGTRVGTLTARDEDASQKLSFTLLDDDNGMFKIVGNELQKASAANYETAKSHSVTVEARDNGNPSMKVRFITCLSPRCHWNF